MMRDKGSALSSFHRNVKRNMQISADDQCILMRKFGKTEDEIETFKASNAGINIYVLIINLFKRGTGGTDKKILMFIDILNRKSLEIKD